VERTEDLGVECAVGVWDAGGAAGGEDFYGRGGKVQGLWCVEHRAWMCG